MGISEAWLGEEFRADAQERLRQLHELAERDPLALTGDWPVGPDNTSKKFPVPEARSYEFPWYLSGGHRVTNDALQWLPWRWGQVGTAQDNDFIQKLTGPANPFNVPGQIHHGVDTTAQGWRLGDPTMMAQGALETGLAAAGPAVAGGTAMRMAKGPPPPPPWVRNVLKHEEQIPTLHGTRVPDDFDRFKRGHYGVHSGTLKQAEEFAQGEGGRIMPLLLGPPDRPFYSLEVSDRGLWAPGSLMSALRTKKVRFEPEEIEAIKAADRAGDAQAGYRVIDDVLYRNRIDLLRYKNAYEDRGQTSWLAYAPGTVFSQTSGRQLYGVPGVVVGGGAYGLAGDLPGDPRHADSPDERWRLPLPSMMPPGGIY